MGWRFDGQGRQLTSMFDTLTNLDLLIRNAVHHSQSAVLTQLAFALSFIGDTPFMSVMFLLLAGILLRLGRGVAARTLAVVMAGDVVLQNGLKLLFARPRPEPFFGPLPGDYSFPSGHAMSAICFFGTLVLLTAGRATLAVRLGLLAAVAALIAGIGWSRIYLGVHYPSDVVGGFGIGAAWIGLLVAIGQLRFEQPRRIYAAPLPPLPETGTISRRVLVVISRNPGSLRDRPAMQATLRPLLEAVGLRAEFADLESPDLSRLITRAAADGYCAIVAAGGDGTICRVARDLVHGTTPLGVIPLGTMNVFARDVGIPIDDLHAAVAVIGACHTRQVDIGEVNGRVFLCASMLGLPARLAQYRLRGDSWWESLRIWSRFVRAFLRALLRYRPLRATLALGKRTLRIRVSSLMVTPNKINDIHGPSFGRGDLEGGRLAVYVVGRLHVHDVIRLGLRTLFQRWQKDRLVTDYVVQRLAIAARSPGLRVMNDGEVVVLRPPLRYRLLPRALRVICPEPAAVNPEPDVLA